MQSKKDKTKDSFIGYKIDLTSYFLKGMYPKFFKEYTDKSDSFVSRILSKTKEKGRHLKSNLIETVISAKNHDTETLLDIVSRTGVSLKKVTKLKGSYETAKCSLCGRIFVRDTNSKYPVCRDCLRKIIIKQSLNKYNFKDCSENKNNKTKEAIKYIVRVDNTIYSYYKARKNGMSAIYPADNLFEMIVWIINENVCNDRLPRSFKECANAMGISTFSLKRKIFAKILESEQELFYEKTKGVRIPISDNITDFLYLLFNYTGRLDNSKHEQSTNTNNLLSTTKTRRKSLKLSLPNCPTIQD